MDDPHSLTNPFYRLSPFLQEYIYSHNWENLRPVQTAAAEVLFNSDSHLLLAAGTASGKTEAAFFPILTELCEDPPASVGVLYIAPLKALINDQFLRLNEICGESGITVTGWHGDISQSKKKKLIEHPEGILQITPESLQALLLRRHNLIPRLFGDLRYIIIDEIHSLMRGDRGMQVQALLTQLERLSGTTPRRVGLSATVGDPRLAAQWLSAGTERQTIIPELAPIPTVWHLAMEHFTKNTTPASGGGIFGEIPLGSDAGLGYIFSHCMGPHAPRKSLIFTTSREESEVVCASLRQYAEAAGVPDRFLIHHGNLSAAIRENAEEKMKDDTVPCHTVTTATLELGIDIGKLECAFQLDSPATVSSFLQRMGRTGRRGLPPEMRFVFREEPHEDRAPLPELLPWELLQGIAIVTLYAEDRFVEPARQVKYPYSLLYHQTICVLLYSGELRPSELARRVLTLPPFRDVPQEDFRELLSHMLSIGHLETTQEKGLIVGLKAEKLCNNFKFFAVFQENEEFSVHCESQELGTVVSPPPAGQRLAIAGRVWDVKEIDIKKKQVFVTPVKGVVPAYFGLCPGDIHTRVLEKMRELLFSDKKWSFLRPSALQRLEEARHLARQGGMEKSRLLSLGEGGWCLFPWLGTYAFMACERILRIKVGEKGGIKAVNSAKPYFIVFRSSLSRSELLFAIRSAARQEFSPEDLLFPKETPYFEKYDEFVPVSLLRRHFARDVLDIDAARQVLSSLD